MIGAGAWSRTQLTAWAEVENAGIVALADRHPERRDPVVREFDVEQGYNDFETMLDEAELDFVDVCTRPYSHASLTKLAADRGLPVLCQKPFCRTLEEAHEVIEYYHQAGVRLMINENFRWQAWFRKIKEVLDSGTLGRPFFAKFHRRKRLTLPEFEHTQAYFADMPRLLVYEVGTHLLDVFRFLFGEPREVSARLQRISRQIKGEDVAVITVGYQDMTCMIYDSWASVPIPDFYQPRENMRLLEIDGTQGTLFLGADGTLHLFSDTDHQTWQFPEDTIAASHTAAQQHFIDCLEQGAEFETDGPETLKTMALVYSCYLSDEEERVVHPEELLPT